MTEDFVLRDATDDDALDVIELIGGVFAEYPHCILDVDGEMPELRRPATYHREHGGNLWVAEAGGRIVGSAGFVHKAALDHPEVVPGARGDAGIELKKLYVHRRARRTGLGGALVERVEREARARGAAFVDLWSDTRFTTAHAFYERRGWVRGPRTRELHDKSHTVEHYFAKLLAP
jgi:putative acetyltransferase